MGINNVSVKETARMNLLNSKLANTIAINSDPGTYAAVYIRCAPGKTVRETLEESVKFNPPSQYPIINLAIQMPCGKGVFYQTLDDIPTTDTPCTCGNPNHYFVKIGETVNATDTPNP